MSILIIGLVVFLGLHLLPIRAPLKAGIVARLGEGAYKGLMSVGSLIGLVLIVWGYGIARNAGAMVLWQPPVAMRHITLLLMIPVFPLLIAAYVPGKIRATVKHPMITAVKLWAFAHLLSNGTLPDVLLFGSFLAWGVIDRISLKRRGVQPPAPVARFTGGDWAAVVIGLVLYGLMVWRLHLLLIGVSPLG
jgi:uncharacterized membrane protein